MDDGLDILVVDLNDDFRTNFKLELELDGSNILVASMVARGLEILRRSAIKPELVISYWGSKGSDGIELLQAIRAHKEWDDIGFVFLTGRESLRDRNYAFKLGIDDWVEKPIDLEAIENVIDAVIKRK